MFRCIDPRNPIALDCRTVRRRILNRDIGDTTHIDHDASPATPAAGGETLVRQMMNEYRADPLRVASPLSVSLFLDTIDPANHVVRAAAVIPAWRRRFPSDRSGATIDVGNHNLAGTDIAANRARACTLKISGCACTSTQSNCKSETADPIGGYFHLLFLRFHHGVWLRSG